MAPLVLLYLLLTYADFLYTRFMLYRYGTSIELNPLVRWASKHVGVSAGTMFGIFVPTFLVISVGINFRPLLELLFLFRFLYFIMQANHLRHELGPFRSRQKAIS